MVFVVVYVGFRHSEEVGSVDNDLAEVSAEFVYLFLYVGEKSLGAPSPLEHIFFTPNFVDVQKHGKAGSYAVTSGFFHCETDSIFPYGCYIASYVFEDGFGINGQILWSNAYSIYRQCVCCPWIFSDACDCLRPHLCRTEIG